MKKICNVLVIQILALFFCAAAFARIGGGSEGGNGGDTYAIQFVDTAKEVLSRLVNNHSHSFSMASFEKAITNTHVDSTEGRLFLNGVLKDAINYPTQNKIVFNRLAWRDLSGERNRFLFVLHEYLGIMGLDDSRYTVSGAALKEIAKDSLVCVSVAQDAYTHFEVTGKAVLNLIGKDSAQWRDQFLNYSISVNASNNPVFFVLSTVDLKSQATQRMIVNLHRAKPEVDLNFSIQTEQKINGYPVTDIEIECH